MIIRKWVFVAGLALFFALMLPLLAVYSEADVVVAKDTIFLGEIPGETTAVDVAGGYAYVGFVDELHVVDVSDLEKPVSIGELQMSEEIRQIQIEDGLAYVLLQNELHIIDTTIPDSPIPRGSYVDDTITAMVVQEPYAYLLNLTDLIVVGVANPDEIGEIGRLGLVTPDTVGFADLAVSDNVAFAAKRFGPTDLNGTYLVDVSDVKSLTLMTKWEQGPQSIAISGDVAYLAGGGCNANICFVGLGAYEVSDLFHPLYLSGDETVGGGGRVYAQGSFAYVTTLDNLSVFHVGNPHDIRLWEIHPINDANDPYSLRDSAVQGNYAYLANGDAFKIIQVHNFFYVHLPIARMAGPE